MSEKRYTIAEAAAYLGVCRERVFKKIKDGHFPLSELCECGKSYLLTRRDLDSNIGTDRRKNKIKST